MSNEKTTSSKRIIEAIASQMIVGVERPSKKVIAGLAAITSKGSFNTTLLNMKKKGGLVEYDKDTVWLTEKGKKMLPSDALRMPQNNDGVQAKLKEQVKGKVPGLIFDILTDGNAYSREDIASKLGVLNNASLGTYISSLSKVSERVDGKKKIQLKDIAFPCGRPCEKETTE